VRPRDDEFVAVLDDFAHNKQDDVSRFDADGRDRPFTSLFVEIDLDLVLVPSIGDNVCHWTTRFNENETSPAPNSVPPHKRLTAVRSRCAARREFI
jgi:hypothetical protein